jgi:hypothetical protein
VVKKVRVSDINSSKYNDYENFPFQKDLILKGISSTLYYSVKKQHVINYDYSEKTGLVEKFIILVLVL